MTMLLTPTRREAPAYDARLSGTIHSNAAKAILADFHHAIRYIKNMPSNALFLKLLDDRYSHPQNCVKFLMLLDEISRIANVERADLLKEFHNAD